MQLLLSNVEMYSYILARCLKMYKIYVNIGEIIAEQWSGLYETK